MNLFSLEEIDLSKNAMEEANTKKRKIAKTKFIAIWFISFCVLFSASSILGIIPEPEDDFEANALSPAVHAESLKVSPEVPLRIEAPAIGLNTPVLNPQTRDINALDAELQKGAVRYPGTGKAGQDANMFIFGHSSYLPVVHNEAYRAFNDLSKLREGDEILVYGSEAVYTYEVKSVKEVQVKDAVVKIDTGKPMLTLSTCNTFGDLEEDRFIVEAELKEVEVK